MSMHKTYGPEFLLIGGRPISASLFYFRIYLPLCFEITTSNSQNLTRYLVTVYKLLKLSNAFNNA